MAVVTKGAIALVASTLAMAAPAAGAVQTFVGSFSVSGATGPVASWGGTFRFTFDTSLNLVNDFTPDEFDLTIGFDDFGTATTRVDTALAPFSIGARDFIIGADLEPFGDTNNVCCAGTSADFRFRAILNEDNQLVSARGQYRVSGGGIGAFDTSMTDGSSATFVISAVPEPASWALMIAGFGLVGAATRRRAARVVFA